MERTDRNKVLVKPDFNTREELIDWLRKNGLKEHPYYCEGWKFSIVGEVPTCEHQMSWWEWFKWEWLKFNYM